MNALDDTRRNFIFCWCRREQLFHKKNNAVRVHSPPALMIHDYSLNASLCESHDKAALNRCSIPHVIHVSHGLHLVCEGVILSGHWPCRQRLCERGSRLFTLC